MDRTCFLYLVTLVLVLLVQYCFITCSASSAMNVTKYYKTEQSALLAFKAHITFDPHHTLANNWSITTSICHWIGVSCSTSQRRVTALNLPNLGLQGTLPPHLGNLSFLAEFNISNNRFHGHLPNELAQLHQLKLVDFNFNNFIGVVPSWFGTEVRCLHLANNSFTGVVPLSLCNMSRLDSLDLGNNFLQGNIPEEMGSNLPNLKRLYMGHNQLSGPIPSTIFNVSSLQLIDFTSNTLSGTLPDDLCYRLPKLEFLYLSWNYEISGQIPSTLGNCRELQVLSLSYNKFTGVIPRGIGNLNMLKELYIGDNNLKGEIPQEMGGLRSLEILAIENGGLSGLIPSSIFNITSLKQLYLYQNKFRGSIPTEIRNCTALKLLIFGGNNLTGVIPQEIGNLHNLEALDLESNSLRGPIPSTIYNISTLRIILLMGNHLSGNLPSSIGLRLPNLEGLYLGGNHLSGLIPVSISNASKLTELSVAFNEFIGPIPNSLSNLGLLQRLFLGGNHFITESSSPEISFLTPLANCRHLRVLWIADNPLNGLLPTVSIGNLSNSLKFIDASSCGIRGNIPNDIGNLTNLAFLNLNGNDLTGFIPTTVKWLQRLQKLDFGNNKLQGSIPNDLCHLQYLGSLSLSKNQIFGPVPTCLGNITSLRYLYIDSNRLSSKIPASLWSLKDLLRFNLSSNSLSGHLPPEIASLKVAILIDLSMNQFSGVIPSTIGGLQNLITLSLAHNRLGGSIPESFGHMVGLEFLDLSYNNLTGVIPKTLEALLYLKYFNVSFNSLRGEIPTRGPFANFTNRSFMSNEALCGASQLQVQPCNTSTSLHRSRKLLLIIWVLSAIGFIMLVLTFAFLLIRCWRTKKILTQTELLPIPRITYQELLQATNRFEESNLLGKGSFGSVYKGIFSDGMVVAIKVFNLQIESAFKSFETECEIMRNICHRNLTKVITSCSNLDFKSLLLEYMPNGSLEKWLYSHNYVLDILQRLDIMIDVACALDYLHHGYSTPVVHCDLKPSNVLLDKGMVAHVSDFGISKLLSEEERIAQTKTIGTIGYIAPEYGREGLLSTRCDVYSYGIMLMETFTRMKPTDEMFTGEMSLKHWVKESLPNAIIQVIDANLLRPEERNFSAKVQCVSSIMELALDCSTESPQERINMKDVEATLRKIRFKLLANLEGT